MTYLVESKVRDLLKKRNPGVQIGAGTMEALEDYLVMEVKRMTHRLVESKTFTPDHVKQNDGVLPSKLKKEVVKSDKEPQPKSKPADDDVLD